MRCNVSSTFARFTDEDLVPQVLVYFGPTVSAQIHFKLRLFEYVHKTTL